MKRIEQLAKIAKEIDPRLTVSQATQKYGGGSYYVVSLGDERATFHMRGFPSINVYIGEVSTYRYLSAGFRPEGRRDVDSGFPIYAEAACRAVLDARPYFIGAVDRIRAHLVRAQREVKRIEDQLAVATQTLAAYEQEKQDDA